MFLRSRNPFLTFLLSYHVRVTSKIQVNFRYRRYLKVLMILSYKFLKFLHYLCFWGQEIHFWHSYWATMFGWPWKSRSTSGIGGTDDSVLWIFEISSIFMFRGQEIHCWHSYWASLFGLPWKSRSTSGTEGTDDCVLWIFDISSLFMFSRSSNRILTFLQSYHVWVTSKIQVNFRFRRYWWFCLMDFEISLLFMLSRSMNPLLIFLLSYLVWVTSKIWVNFRF